MRILLKFLRKFSGAKSERYEFCAPGRKLPSAKILLRRAKLALRIYDGGPAVPPYLRSLSLERIFRAFAEKCFGSQKSFPCEGKVSPQATDEVGTALSQGKSAIALPPVAKIPPHLLSRLRRQLSRLRARSGTALNVHRTFIHYCATLRAL